GGFPVQDAEPAWASEAADYHYATNSGSPVTCGPTRRPSGGLPIFSLRHEALHNELARRVQLDDRRLQLPAPGELQRSTPRIRLSRPSPTPSSVCSGSRSATRPA